jgi:hypothetical protein
LGFGGGWPFLLFDGSNDSFGGFAAVDDFGWGGGGLVGVLVFGAQPANQAVAFFGGAFGVEGDEAIEDGFVDICASLLRFPEVLPIVGCKTAWSWICLRVETRALLLYSWSASLNSWPTRSFSSSFCTSLVLKSNFRNRCQDFPVK